MDELRNVDTSKTITTANTYQTAIVLSTIARFNRFYGDQPVKLFDGSNRLEGWRQVPFEQRLEYRDAYGTFVYDEANETMYLNGRPNYAATLYIHHIKDSPEITDDDSSSWIFPSWAHPLLAFYAVGLHKGGIDYDDVNARMAPDNRAQAAALLQQLENWDSEKQLSSLEASDPSDRGGGYRPGAINIDA